MGLDAGRFHVLGPAGDLARAVGDVVLPRHGQCLHAEVVQPLAEGGVLQRLLQPLLRMTTSLGGLGRYLIDGLASRRARRGLRLGRDEVGGRRGGLRRVQRIQLVLIRQRACVLA